MKLARWLVLVVVASATVAPATAQEPGVDKSENVTVVGGSTYVGGTEVGFADGFVYAGQKDGRTRRGELPAQGGIRIFDAGGGEVGVLDCPGHDMYVRAVRPGLIAVAHHRARCNPAGFPGIGLGDGMFLADVSDPANPVTVGGTRIPSAHTLTIHPSGEYVYVNPGGLANANGVEAIVDVSDPAAPRVVKEFVPSRIGCHDGGFHPTEPYFYCAGLGEIQVWDVTDPVAPVTVNHVLNPAIQFAHNAQVSPSGKWLVVNDEAFGFHDCKSPDSVYGALWIYDLTVDASVPVLAGRIARPTSRATIGNYVDWSDSWCTSHNYNFIDDDTVVTGWFTGGTTVHDISDPLFPVQLAYYKPSDTIAYTAHWYDGRIYVNDSNRGMEVLEVDLPAPDPARAARYEARPKPDLLRDLILPNLTPRPGPYLSHHG